MVVAKKRKAAEGEEERPSGKRRLREIIPRVGKRDHFRVWRVGSISYELTHYRKCRNLYIGPPPHRQIVTGGLDGQFKFWSQICSRSPPKEVASVQAPVSDLLTEDFAWHPSGEHVFAVFGMRRHSRGFVAGQVARIAPQQNGADSFRWLPEKPHQRGGLTCIEFMPWSSNHDLFLTGGEDHLVVAWKSQGDGTWSAEPLYDWHSSTVCSVTGTRHKSWALSGGLDKRIHVFDVNAMNLVYNPTLDDQVVALYVNPVDPNLLLSQSCDPGTQLKLYDLRQRLYVHLHQFGWDCQRTVSRQVHGSWSPRGYSFACGSRRRDCFLFDIRFNSRLPSHCIQFGDKPILKAAWHPDKPDTLLTFSSDSVMCTIKLQNAAQ